MRAVNNRISDNAGNKLDTLAAHFESQRVALETIIRDGFKTYIPQEAEINRVKIGNIDTVSEHDPYHRGQCTPTTTVLYINPKTEHVNVSQDYDQGATDTDVWHHRVITHTLSGPDECGEGTSTPNEQPLEQYLNSPTAQKLLRTIVDNYSIDWDGHNMIGSHTDESNRALDQLLAAIEDLPHTTYAMWDTSDYLQHVLNEITAETTNTQLDILAQKWQPEANEILNTDILDYITEHRDSLRE